MASGIDAPLREVQRAVAHTDGAHHQVCYGSATPRPIGRIGWIVAITHSQAEHWAESNLQRIGYVTFLPTCVVMRRDAVVPSLRRRMIVPLFRGYLFVRYDSRDPRRPIREAPGVRDVIRCGTEVQWVPEAAVSALQAGETVRRAEGRGKTEGPPRPSWRAGEACEIRGGPFDGHAGVVERIGNASATVTLMVLGGLRGVTVPIAQLGVRDG